MKIFALLLLAATACAGQPPAFVVENKMSAATFTVVNCIAALPSPKPAVSDVPIEFDLRALDKLPSSTVDVWNSLPLNRGNCPCGATGGCHCQLHSECGAGRCSQHNPLLQPTSYVQPAIAQPAAAPNCPT